MSWTGLPYQAPEDTAAAAEARRSQLEHVRSSWQARLGAAAQACTLGLHSALVMAAIHLRSCHDLLQTALNLMLDSACGSHCMSPSKLPESLHTVVSFCQV